MAHTPGPWTFIEGDRKKQAMSDIMAKDDFRIGYVLCEWSSNPAREQDIANARLIAAAPELLAALESIINLETDDDGDRIIPPGFLDQARAAIAKATQP